MKPIIVSVVCVLGAVAGGSAFAQECPAGTTTRVTSGTPASPNSGGNFTTFITGATICAVRGNDRWQEFHQAGGALIDWKLGASHPVDPTTQVGTWSASNGSNAVVTHTYGGTSYSWAVCREGTAPTNITYTLVSLTGGTITGARIFSGQGACP